MSSMLLRSCRQPFQRVVLALDRDEHLARGDERVDREEPEARAGSRRARSRAARCRLLLVVEVRVDRPLEARLAGDQRDELDLGAGEVDRGRRAPEVLDVGARLDDLRERLPSTSTS